MRLSTSLYRLVHRTKMLIGKQQLLLSAYVSAWNSPQEAAIHQKGGLPLPENGCGGWRFYLAKISLVIGGLQKMMILLRSKSS